MAELVDEPCQMAAAAAAAATSACGLTAGLPLDSADRGASMVTTTVAPVHKTCRLACMQRQRHWPCVVGREPTGSVRMARTHWQNHLPRSMSSWLLLAVALALPAAVVCARDWCACSAPS